jgi:ABC-type branched-subunit amino acid transport system ATPase component
MALITRTNAHLALDHVAYLLSADFSLELGKCVVLIGRNGMNLIAGDKPSITSTSGLSITCKNCRA